MPKSSDFAERRAGPDDAGRRLDRVIRSYLGELPLSAVFSALRTRRILVNGRRAEGGYRVVEGDSLAFDPELLSGRAPDASAESPGAQGIDALADILVLATADLLFLNKPRGILVHGPESLETRVKAALQARSGESLSFVPGPLHRLDRNSSGLVTFPASSAGARAFTGLLRSRRVEKRYLALAEGRMEAEEPWSDLLERDSDKKLSAIGDRGTEARARALPLLSDGRYSLLLVHLQTGLTHQIRAQAASRGHPLAGDAKYGGSPFPGGYILHALSLRFPEPPFPDLPAQVVAELPARPRDELRRLFGEAAVENAIIRAIET